MTLESSKTKRWPLFILIGCLSMFMAEVFAGSSQMWFIDAWSLIVTYWLYLGHLLLFLNIAIRMKRTSIPQLYLYGVLFGLYESWITKVLWSGYPGSEGPAIALISGIAILEFCTLVFFWHPILAFIMPIIVFESFAISNESTLRFDQKIFMSHKAYLTKSNKKANYFYLFLILIGATFLSFNSRFNIIVSVIAITGSIGLIYLFFILSKRKSTQSFSIYSLKLGKKGFSLVIIYLISLYILTFFFLMPQNIPTSIVPFLIIMGFYGLIVFLIYKSKPINESISIESNLDKYETKDHFNSNYFFKLYLLFLLLTIIFSLIIIFTVVLAIILFLGIFLISPIIFLLFLKSLFKKK